jgi:G-patch domain
LRSKSANLHMAWPAGDEHSKAAAAELEERNRIQSDNVGHRLLSKMGWKEGEVLLCICQSTCIYAAGDVISHRLWSLCDSSAVLAC